MFDSWGAHPIPCTPHWWAVPARSFLQGSIPLLSPSHRRPLCWMWVQPQGLASATGGTGISGCVSPASSGTVLYRHVLHSCSEALSRSPHLCPLINTPSLVLPPFPVSLFPLQQFYFLRSPPPPQTTCTQSFVSGDPQLRQAHSDHFSIKHLRRVLGICKGICVRIQILVSRFISCSFMLVLFHVLNKFTKTKKKKKIINGTILQCASF